MNNNKNSQIEIQEVSSLSTLALLVEWVKRHEKSWLFRFGIVLLGFFLIAAFGFLSSFAIRKFENSWYSIYFMSTQNKLLWEAILIIGIDVVRWLAISIFNLFGILLVIFLLTNIPIPDSFPVFGLKIIVIGVVVVGTLIGLQNLVLYSVIGWKNIDINNIGEGISLFLFCSALAIVVLGINNKSSKRNVILESLFNLNLILIPTSVVLTSTLGGFKTAPQWYLILIILILLFILIVGIDELKGKPTIYTYIVTSFRLLEVGHNISLQTLKKRSAEALADGLTVYKRLPQEQQETLAKWILDNNKPSFVNRFWAIVKIVVSTVLLTTLVQEPAIIAFKWLLKMLFGYSY